MLLASFLSVASLSSYGEQQKAEEKATTDKPPSAKTRRPSEEKTAVNKPELAANTALAPPQVRLRSQHFAVPLTLENDPLKRRITSIELRFPKLDEKPVNGTIKLDEGHVSFDDFGDVTTVRRRGGAPLAVKIKPLGSMDENKSTRRLYRV